MPPIARRTPHARSASSTAAPRRVQPGLITGVALAGLLALTPLLAGPARADVSLRDAAAELRIEPVLADLEEPWAVAFLPDGGLLVSERGGTLIHAGPDGTRRELAGVPEVQASGQGGLLDVVVARDFASSRTIFLTYAKPLRGGAATALASARLSADGTTLEDLRDLYVAPDVRGGGRHFGSRVVEAHDGTLFLTIGDRGRDADAQNLASASGSVVRVNRDGTIPADNPRPAGGLPELWSWGHRNAQGAALDADGNLWISEHGARGGDEVNLVRKGLNYGWPVIAYGRHYSGLKIGEGTHKEGMEQPAFYWDPSMAPSGTMVYSGRLWPEWRGHVFVGALQHDYIARLAPDGPEKLRAAGGIEGPETARVRDVREGPDGAIWFLSVGNGTLYRVTPAP